VGKDDNQEEVKGTMFFTSTRLNSFILSFYAQLAVLAQSQSTRLNSDIWSAERHTVSYCQSTLILCHAGIIQLAISARGSILSFQSSYHIRALVAHVKLELSKLISYGSSRSSYSSKLSELAKVISYQSSQSSQHIVELSKLALYRRALGARITS